jgi:NAD(P)H-binding
MSSHKSVAFFGATGGSTAPCLAQCLKAGYTCTARKSAPLLARQKINLINQTVARNAEKLATLLQSTHSVTPELISKNLTIIVGNVKDPVPVTQVLFPAILNPSNPTSGSKSVDIIVSGIGCYPIMKKGHWLPEQEDPTLCQDAISTILNALRARPPLVKPGLVMLSTTGISRFGRDVPLLMTPFYTLLHTAHQDKRAMEDMAIAAVEEDKAPIGSYTLLRPSLLTNGEAKGVQNVRWNVENGSASKKVVGYTISRADVGGFLFEKVVKPFESGKGEGRGQVFVVTY